MRLTAAGCGRLFASTLERRPEAYEGRFACLNCPIGARHAGVVINPAADAVETWRMVCPRCRTLATRIIAGALCISCQNRHYEALKGRDAKGHRPRLADRLHVERLAVIEGGETRLAEAERVLSAGEVMVLEAKKATGPLAFTRPRPPWLPTLAADGEEAVAA